MMNAEKRLSSVAAGQEKDSDAIRERFFATGDASSVLAGRSEMVDRAVITAWHDHLAPVYPEGMTVLAVGGYGRKELFPHSDVDLLLLVEQAPAGPARAALSAFLRTLWDGRLRLSQSVRTVKECCELHDRNIELNISLLDQRYLAGDVDLYERLTTRLPKFLHGQRQQLIRELCQLTRPRHGKYQNTIYHLEPNIKEAPGGLRDLHLLWWLNKLRHDAASPGEWRDGLDSSRAFLSAVRCFLHYRAGRDDNGLSFEAQEELSRTALAPHGDPATSMREYFLYARAVHRAAIRAMEDSEGQTSSLLRGFRQWRSRLSNAEFTVANEQLFFKSPRSVAYDPELAIRLFQFVARHGLSLARETERRIAEHLPLIERHFAQQKPHWAALLDLLRLPRTYQALLAMNETGVLRAVFPEWNRVECLVVRDFYHRYTVDEHTLLAIKSIEDLRKDPEPARRRFANLLEELDDPGVLNLALLLHDIGMGAGGGKHVEKSLELADGAMERIQLPVRKRMLVRFLIERHLDLSVAMTQRDLNDPATARRLADDVGAVERLKHLALLTYADVSAVNPGAMSPWRLEQLWRVYVTAHNELTRELDTDRIHDLAGESDERRQFLEGFPVRYLRTHTDAEIEGHLKLERESRGPGVAVQIQKDGNLYGLAIVARDRPGLLASVAGTLASFGLNIVKAEAFANSEGVVLDTFTFADPTRNLDLNPPEVDRLALTLKRVALRKLKARELLQSRPSPAPPSRDSQIEPRVSFNNEASEATTLIELTAQDRPGLLHAVATALSDAGCNIEVVLLDTEAHKAIDVFYVTRDGRKLAPAETEPLRQALLNAAKPPG